MNVGDKIKMEGERQRYTVQAFNNHLVVMTKPFNAQKTYLYTIADKQRMERGPIGLVFGLPHDVNTPDGAADLLDEMASEGWEVSYRKSVPILPSEADQMWPGR